MGTKQTLILAQSLSESQVIHTDKHNVKSIQSIEQVYSTADVCTEIKAKFFLLYVGMIEKSPSAVILGRDITI